MLLRLPRAEFLRIAAADPRAWHLLAVLSTRNTALALDLIAMLRRTRPEERLLHLVHLLGRELPGPLRMLPVTQVELGAIARMSRSGVNAALGALERQGLIRVVYGGIELVEACADCDGDFSGLIGAGQVAPFAANAAASRCCCATVSAAAPAI